MTATAALPQPGAADFSVRGNADRRRTPHDSRPPLSACRLSRPLHTRPLERHRSSARCSTARRHGAHPRARTPELGVAEFDVEPGVLALCGATPEPSIWSIRRRLGPVVDEHVLDAERRWARYPCLENSSSSEGSDVRSRLPRRRQRVRGRPSQNNGSWWAPAPPQTAARGAGAIVAATTRLNSLGNAGGDEKSGGTFCADAGPSDERGAVSMTRSLMMASISAISASIAWARRASIRRLSLVSEVRSRRVERRAGMSQR